MRTNGAAMAGPPNAAAEPKTDARRGLACCGDERDRTVGLLSAIQALSQLSYIPNTPDAAVARGDILRSGAPNATGQPKALPQPGTGRCLGHDGQ